jgi:hypothetical protein
MCRLKQYEIIRNADNFVVYDTIFATCVTRAVELFVFQLSHCSYRFKVMSPILAIVWHPEKETVVIDYRIQPMCKPWVTASYFDSPATQPLMLPSPSP